MKTKEDPSTPNVEVSAHERLGELGASVAGLGDDVARLSADASELEPETLARVESVAKLLAFEVAGLKAPERAGQIHALSLTLPLPGGGEVSVGSEGGSVELPGVGHVSADGDGVSASTAGASATVGKNGAAVDVPGVGNARVDADGVDARAGGTHVMATKQTAAISIPGLGSVTVDEGGASVNVGGGSVKIGTDGASVDLPGVGTVAVGSDGSVSVGGGTIPGTGVPNLGGLPIPTFGAAPFEIPIPVPTFKVEKLEIPIPVPCFETKCLDIPLGLPNVQLPALPNLPNIQDLIKIPEVNLPDVNEILGDLFEPEANETSDTKTDPLHAMIQFGLMQWRMQARFRDVIIDAGLARGAPGCLTGPDIEQSFRSYPLFASWDASERAFATSVARGVARSFQRWVNGVTVPGLPWYPAFIAFPAPHAPPMPNIPTPLVLCASPRMSEIVTASRLRASVVDELPDGAVAPNVEARVAVITAKAASLFAAWLSVQFVTKVLGQGPVPSFAPPVAPVGPVINGSIISVPGHLAS